jgi:branched-chain amino acid transport system substrate-binding protein
MNMGHDQQSGVPLSRRRLIGGIGAGALTLGFGGVVGVAGSAGAQAATRRTGRRVAGSGGTVRIGYVTPTTGPLAPFGEADEFVLAAMREALSGGITIGGGNYNVEIVDKNSESSSDRASQVAQELIFDDGVQLVLVSSTPDTTNPVADQCEANAIPCISTVAPWQPYYLGRGGSPTDTEPAFTYTYHFFWGLEDVIGVFLSMWSQVETNKVVGGLFPNDPDGNAWGDSELGFPPPLAEAGYTIVDPGRYTTGTSDFSAQIGEFKSAGAELLTGVPIPPDFTTFWTQAAQQDFRPAVASVGKALLFPSSVEALGDLGNGLSTEVWWSPNHPFTSSLTEQTAADLAAAYTDETGKQWTQPIGFAHALFEVAVDVLTRSEDPMDADRVVEAIAATKLDTIVGNIDWSTGPVPNVAKTKLVGGQWRPGTEFDYDLVIVANDDLPDVPAEGPLEPIA